MNENDQTILMCLVNTNAITGKEISRETGVVESVVSKHLNALRTHGIVEYTTCSPQDGKRYTGKCWELVSAPDVFETLIHLFIQTEHFESFLESDYVDAIELDPPGYGAQIIVGAIAERMEMIAPLLDYVCPGNTLVADALALEQRY